MRYVYIDESGDIGSKSKYIVFAAIITQHDRKLEKIVKKTWRAKPQYHNKGRLHSVDVDDATRIRILSKVTELDVTIKTHYYKKKQSIKGQSLQYYSELAKFIAICGDAQVLVVERKDTIKHRKAIINKLGLTIEFKNVIFGDPHEYKQLQAVDFIAWSYGRKLESKDSSFWSIVRGKNE
ncbi:MAG TPA: DUF3800 domain-containing protein [Candidatus Saccharibacteria bacterium]|nr:DUF3800 domain-containing protein [Candidatus Saccharibacteria bacterium]